MIKRVPPIDLVKWYAIRDLIFKYDFIKALEIAKNCKYPDAIWFYTTCKDVKDISGFLKVLETLKDDRIALYYYGYFKLNPKIVEKSADLGYIHALCYLSKENFKKIENCALQGERYSCFWLGYMYNVDKFKNYLYAASLGYNRAIAILIEYFKLNYEQKYIIGRAEALLTYGGFYASFYLSQNLKCRKAVDTWTLISTRLRIYKDLRIFISKMIWETRFEALY